MDHACHKCGAEVEEGTAFCRNCGAPQIRVIAPEPQPILPQQPQDELQPSPNPIPLPTNATGAPPPTRTIDWSQGLRAAAGAGALLGISWVLPFTTYFLWMLACGALGVAFYHRRNPGVPLTRGAGARIGAVCGAVAFAIFGVVTSLQLIVTRGSGTLRNLLIQTVQQSAAANPDPRAQELLQKMTSPEGLALMVTFAMVLLFFVFLGFSALGGSLGAAFFNRGNDRQ